MREIPLSSGKVALVDDDDYERVSQFKWSYHALGYAFRGIGGRKGRKYQYMHRFILGEPDHGGQRMVIDHINENRLDNRKENLRLVDKSGNAHNTQAVWSHNKTSGIRGVYRDRTRNKWVGRIKIRDHYAMKYFDDIEAAIAFVQEARSTIDVLRQVEPMLAD